MILLSFFCWAVTLLMLKLVDHYTKWWHFVGGAIITSASGLTASATSLLFIAEITGGVA
jgi:paraquat-inducible protein B